MNILVVNAGSSSIKFALFGEEKTPIWSAEGQFDQLSNLPNLPIEVIGHRVVHGGEKFRKPTYLTKKVEEEIHELCYLAPLHNPICLNGIKQTRRLFPEARHFAVFDTAFHAHIPDVACTYALPLEWREKGIRKYGFHGISYAYIASQIESEKCVVCHLGSGASLCALLNGKSIDTTMGFSPLDGLVMGTRCGALDPSVVIHLMMHEKLFPSKIEHLLNFESGLLGLSGISADMRHIEESQDHHARFALELFTYRFKQQLGQMIAALDGLDTLVFTAGIGENSPTIRKRLLPSYLGIELDEKANNKNAPLISTPNSKVKVEVIPTHEEWQIAKLCRENC